MTRIGKKMEGLEEDSLESVLDEIPDQVDRWMNNYDYDPQMWMGSDVVVVQEGAGAVRGSSSVLYDDDGGCSGLHSFPPPPLAGVVGNQFLTPEFGGYASSGSSVVGGYGLSNNIAGPENGVGSHRLVGVGGGGDHYLCPNSVSMPGFGGMYADGMINMNIDEDELCRYLNKVGIRDDEYVSEVRNQDVDFIGFRFPHDPHYSRLNDKVESLPNGVYDYGGFRNGCSGNGVASQSGHLSCGGAKGGMMMNPSPALSAFQKGRSSDNLFPHQVYPRRSGPSFPPPFGYSSTLPVRMQNVEGQGQVPYCTYRQQVSLPSLSNTFDGVSRPDALHCAPKCRMNFDRGVGILGAPNLQQVMMHQRPLMNISSEQQRRFSSNRIPMPLNSRMPQGGLQDINCEGSFILQGEDLSPVSNKAVDCLRRHVKSFINGSEATMPKGKHTHQVRTSKNTGTYERRQNQHTRNPGVIPKKLGSLSEVYGQLPDVAKHQTQCRLLQDIIEQRDPLAIQAIFDEIIEHVVELMINPFGNYFMQKLLDVCSEEQRTKIIDVVAKEPAVLVQVSMNDHGTRVIQKLIETAKTREQILKIISALEPGFYAMITDSNGNHVIERCLHCFTNKQNKFIFVAAIEYCIEIATDQYGCCVLQKCIGHSTGEYRDCLVAEITNSAFLLSQDAFGNYAVQFILDMKNSLYTSRMISQFRGNYVHLAMQKCSSHVVEKCLKVFNGRNKSELIHELLSFNHFQQLLHDPHANYVIQTALKVSEGIIHQRLVQKIELYRAISRHSPYSKRIFSSKKKK